MTTSPARRAAFEILRRVELEGAYAAVLLANLDSDMRDDDRALCHELVLGVLRRQLWLDCVIEHFAKRGIGKIDLPVKLALRLGLYQLRFLSRVPPSAAVNESVNLVRDARLRSAASFANAVLRRATREPHYDPTTGVDSAAERLAIETSHPLWLIERWTSALGLAETAALARANNESAPIAFRLTQRRKDAKQIMDELKSTDAQVSPSKIAPDAWRIDRYRTARGSERVDAGEQQVSTSAPLRELSRDGLIYLQDEASQLVAHLLRAQPGDRVLDVCAAPGSKTTLLAALAPQASIIASDLHPHRLRTLSELAKKQGASIIKLACDATERLPFGEAPFDRVLVDAPCSGTGTLRHNPEIRWRLAPADIDQLAEKQAEILANAAAVVRPGGRLVYSTCSVEPEENEHVIKNFLNQREDFRRALLDAPFELQTENGAVRTWPHRHDTDGFFIAAIERGA